MNKMLLSAGFVAATIMISGAANAQDGAATKEKQMEAYRAYVQSQGTAPTEAGQAATLKAPAATVIVNTNTPIEPTTTVEKVTAKSYDVSKRKVGLIGGRAYQPRKETIDGGAIKEVTVNGVEVEKEVIKPDLMEGKTIDSNGGDYYSGRKGVQAYKPEEEKPNSNLDVHFTGRFNN